MSLSESAEFKRYKYSQNGKANVKSIFHTGVKILGAPKVSSYNSALTRTNPLPNILVLVPTKSRAVESITE